MTDYPKKDSQKGKLYAAERAAFNGTEWAEILTDDEVRHEVRRGVQWLRNKYGNQAVRGHGDIEVRFPANGYGGAYLRYGANPFFSFTPPSRLRWVILHELAHAVIPAYHPEFDGDRRGHGWCFADVYLALVQHYLGVEWAKKLRSEFKANKVRYRPKRKRNPNTAAPTPPRRKKATTVWVARPVQRDPHRWDDDPEWPKVPVPDGVVYANRFAHLVCGPDGIVFRGLDDRRYGVGVNPGQVNYANCTVIGDERGIPVLWRTSREALLKAMYRKTRVGLYEPVEVPRELVDPEFASEQLVA